MALWFSCILAISHMGAPRWGGGTSSLKCYKVRSTVLSILAKRMFLAYFDSEFHDSGVKMGPFYEQI